MRHRLIPLSSLLVALAACSQPAPSAAQNAALSEPPRVTPLNAVTMKMSFAPIVRRAAPAVVNISSKRVVRQQADPFFQFFGGMAPREQIQGSLGSGAIVRADGVIITNNHVIEGGQEITVSLADRREFPAKVLLADPRSDLAVLKIDTRGESLPVLPIAPRADAQVGDLVLAIGDPFGVGQTVTNGIVSALARSGVGAETSDGGASYIQTDAAINPGNSGGPLVDMSGALVGVNTFIVSRSGGSSGVGFAIPAALVRRVIESAAGGATSVRRGWLGMKLQGVDAETARSLGLDRPQGVVVSGVWRDGPADRAGVHAGDLILAAEGQPVDDEAGLNFVAATHRPGDALALRLRRSGTVRTVSVRLETLPAAPARDERRLGGREPLMGASVVSLSPAVADQYGLDAFTRGVLITEATGAAAAEGFRAGDVVRSVNGREVATTAELASAVQAESWSFVIDRGGRQIQANF